MFKWMNFLKVPTRETSDSSNLPASTEFVHNAIAASGDGSGATLQTTTVTLDSCASLATVNGIIELAKIADIISVGTDYPAWVRIYNDAVSRTVDATRPKYNRPRAGCGVVCDNITIASKLVISQSQTTVFHNEDSPRTSTCYLAVTNLDSVKRAITLTIKYLPKES